MHVDSKNYLIIPALEKIHGIEHVFTTRQNGLGARNNELRSPGDWDRVAVVFGVSPDRVVTVTQVHGENIVQVDEENFRSMPVLQADALITGTRGIAVAVETADCVPILVMDPETPAVAAIHAGWRSTVKTIVHKTIERLCREFHCEPGRMIAAIGPAIGPECYEVDEPVMGPVRDTFPFWRDAATQRENDRWGLDLVKLNRFELLRSGVKAENIHALGICTSCSKDLFYSFRAEGRTGRMLSAIMIK
jgi:hypothetical protein